MLRLLEKSVNRLKPESATQNHQRHGKITQNNTLNRIIINMKVVMKENRKQVEKINIFASFATVNRLTICVNRLTRSKTTPGCVCAQTGQNLSALTG